MWRRGGRSSRNLCTFDTCSSVSGARRNFGTGDILVGRSNKTALDLLEEAGVRSRADAIGELGRGDGTDGEVEQDWGMETIRERRGIT